MGRKAASASARMDRKLVRGPGHKPPGQARRSARTAGVRQTARAAAGHRDQPLNRGQSAGHAGTRTTSVTGPQVTDDIPESAAVLDRELDAIEVYLGTLLEEALGRLD